MGVNKRLYGERHLNAKHEDPLYDRALRNNLRELVTEANRIADGLAGAAKVTPIGVKPPTAAMILPDWIVTVR